MFLFIFFIFVHTSGLNGPSDFQSERGNMTEKRLFGLQRQDFTYKSVLRHKPVVFTYKQ